MPFDFFFSKSVSFPSDLNSGQKISLPGPALSLPGTCIFASRPALFYRNLSVQKKTNRKEISLIGTITKMPFLIREIFDSVWTLSLLSSSRKNRRMINYLSFPETRKIICVSGFITEENGRGKSLFLHCRANVFV